MCCLAFEACSDVGTGPRLSGNDRTVLQAQGDRLVEAIEGYRKAHGNYPTILADAGITPADTATTFGPWSYKHAEADPTFVLSVGDYGRNDFVLSWYPSDQWNRDPHWYWDE
jgi:hypothetical protein